MHDVTLERREGRVADLRSPDPLELTILMPCLNEAETIGICIEKALRFLDTSGVRGEILIADNGSTDGSIEIATEAGARVAHIDQKGYGAALLGGIDAARGTYVIMGDADDSYDFENLGLFVDRLRAGADLVMGNRFKGRIHDGAMPFLHRYLGNPVLTKLGQLFFRIPVGDFHCGIRGFRVAAIKALNLQTTGMEFASEMVVRGSLAHLKIDEVPTTLKPDGRSRAPHLKTWRDGWRHLKFLLVNSPKWLFIYPGMALIGVGGLIVLALAGGELRLPNGTVLDLNAFIVGCLFVVAGSQAFTFGVVARYYATRAGFLPRSRRAVVVDRLVSTDRMVQAAALAMALGLALLTTAVGIWGSRNFGPLPGSVIPRLVMGSATIILVGVQLFFSAFLLGVLEIPLKTSRDVRLQS